MMARLAACTAAVAIALAACSGKPPDPPPFGFTRQSAAAERSLESRFLNGPDADRIRSTHRELTRTPHPAGSPRDRELADWTALQFRAAGLEEVAITTHEVMLPRPLEISVEMTAPRAWRATMREDPVAGDADTHADAGTAGLPYHAYSASGEITAPVVYAGGGKPGDYHWLAAQGIDVRGRIVLVELGAPYSYRGFKALTAERHGAAGILMYSDPAADGAERGRVYPDGPWSPDSRIERGGIAYDFLVPGDPLTPGLASVPGAARVARADAVSLPTIISVPLSARDARFILQSLDGPAAPSWWSGSSRYRAGPGPGVVRMKVRIDDSVRPIWTVTGMLRGTESPDQVVIVGNHRDAWVYGGVDPSSGSATVLELARTFGVLAREGWRPKRSVLFASWDAEELALTSSTEWGEQHEGWLRDRAVAYLNVDSAASGARFVAGAVPSLMRVITESANAVRDPSAGISVAAIARGRAATERGRPATGHDDEVVEDRLGGGSDYAVFLNHLGIPSADLAFDGPFGVSHSIYDTHAFVSAVADPGFRYHAALVKVLGVTALRLIQADAVPLDPVATAARILVFIGEVEARHGGVTGGVQPDLLAAARELEQSAASFAARRDRALGAGDTAALGDLNRTIIGLERAFLDHQGLAGRPWYRHLIHAPQPTYQPQVLPGLTDAVDEVGNTGRLASESSRLAAALRRAAARLDGR